MKTYLRLNLIQTCLLAAVLFALPAAVQAQFNYTTNNSAITITGYIGSGGAVNIPATINGLPVISIGDEAFEYTSLTSVTIPDSVTSIGDGAFWVCYNLANVAMGNSVTNIGVGAFGSCENLVHVFFAGNAPNISGGSVFFYDGDDGDGPYVIGDPATIYYLSGTTGWSSAFDAFTFRGKTLGIPTVMINATGDGFEYLSDDVKVIITGYSGSNSVLTIPATITGLPITSIGSYAFAGSGLTNVTIPDSITNIGNGTFFECFSLTNVTIGNGVTGIGDEAFEECYNLTSVTIPNSVTSIGDEAFYDCESLTIVTIPDHVNRIGDCAFSACSSLTNITVSAQNPVYSSVDGVLFDKNQTTLVEYPTGGPASYTIPDSVTSIGDGAFEGTSLTSVTIGNGVTSIGDEAFAFTALTKVFFAGNAPAADLLVPDTDPFLVTVYYLPGTLGWSNTFAGLPTAPWFLPQPLILNQGPGFGMQSNQFDFTISWATNVPVVVEACSNLSSPVWFPVSTNILVGGTSYFSDPQPLNYPARYYRLRSP